MTFWSDDFLGQDNQKLPLQRNLGDAFATLLRGAFPRHSAKELSSELGVDPTTARNGKEGRAGGAALTRSLHYRQAKHDDHWDLWDAIGALIFGETRDQYDERQLAALIERTENARSLSEQRRRARALLEERAAAGVGLEPRAISG